MKVVKIGPRRLANTPQVITEVVDGGKVWPENIPLVIAEGMLIEVDLGHKRTPTLTFVIGEQKFMLKGEVDIGLLPATITTITKVKV